MYRCPILAALVILPLLANGDERRIAQWIIRQGGQVMVNGGPPIAALADLPEDDFRITGVDLYGTPTVPKDLERLTGLTELRELYLSSKTYSPSSDKKGEFADESFQYLAKLTKLEKLHVSLHFLPHIDISDAGWRHMSGQTQLKELRLALTRITKPEVLAPFINLHSLDLSQAYVADEAMKALESMTGLKRLSLAGTQVTEAGVQHIQNLTGLEDLDLTGIPLTDRGLESGI
jgi:Leucine-rich repeat (LRR) protein